jgi:hypothetical protein
VIWRLSKSEDIEIVANIPTDLPMPEVRYCDHAVRAYPFLAALLYSNPQP